MEEKGKNNADNSSWKERMNFNTRVAILLILFSILFYVLIPYQIAKPKLFMGRALMQMQPTLFPRLTMIGLLGLSVWYFFHSFKLKEKNFFKELDKRGLSRIVVAFIILRKPQYPCLFPGDYYHSAGNLFHFYQGPARVLTGITFFLRDSYAGTKGVSAGIAENESI
jgi:hypothetical protein